MQWAGRRNLIWRAGGIFRNSNADTTMPECVRPIFCSSAQIASTYPNPQRFLTELTLDPPSATSDEAGVPLLDEDYLILSTIHSAKGQEWKTVFVLNCAGPNCCAVDGHRSAAAR